MIIEKNENFVLCVKKVNISSQKSSDEKETMLDLIAQKIGTDAKNVFPIHRLDYSVGGVMVYALNKESAGKLGYLASENKITKKYLAVLKGVPKESEGILEDLLFKDSSKNKSFVVKRMRKGVRKASLYYKTLAVCEHEGKIYSLNEITLHTGRTHQIRVQFSSRGTPLAGDRRYGSGKDGCNVGLWSYSLEFPDPYNKDLPIKIKKEPDWSKAPWNIFNKDSIFEK